VLRCCGVLIRLALRWVKALCTLISAVQVTNGTCGQPDACNDANSSGSSEHCALYTTASVMPQRFYNVPLYGTLLLSLGPPLHARQDATAVRRFGHGGRRGAQAIFASERSSLAVSLMR